MLYDYFPEKLEKHLFSFENRCFCGFGGDKRDRTADLLNAMLPLVISNPYKRAISSIIYTNIEHYHTHLTTIEAIEFQNYGQNCGQLGIVLAGAEYSKNSNSEDSFYDKNLALYV